MLVVEMGRGGEGGRGLFSVLLARSVNIRPDISQRTSTFNIVQGQSVQTIKQGYDVVVCLCSTNQGRVEEISFVVKGPVRFVGVLSNKCVLTKKIEMLKKNRNTNEPILQLSMSNVPHADSLQNEIHPHAGLCGAMTHPDMVATT